MDIQDRMEAFINQHRYFKNKRGFELQETDDKHQMIAFDKDGWKYTVQSFADEPEEVVHIKDPSKASEEEEMQRLEDLEEFLKSKGYSVKLGLL